MDGKEAEIVRVKIKAYEDELESAIDVAMSMMNAAIDDQLVIKAFSSLVKIQLEYHEQCKNILSDYVSELERR